MHDRAIYWIVVEDAPVCARHIRDSLVQSDMLYAHVAVETPENVRRNRNSPRGVSQRNLALDIIDDLDTTGVVYFGDDDNAYDVQLFNELRMTTRVSVGSVAFSGGGAYERCLVDVTTGEVRGFATNWFGGRKFPIDMGGLAFHKSILSEKHPRFSNKYPSELETRFVEQIVDRIADLKPMNENCTKVYVWHVKTNIPDGTLHVEGDSYGSMVLV